MKESVVIWLLLLSSAWLAVPVSYAAMQAQTTLAVEIQPMAAIEAPSIVNFSADSDTVELPVKVKVRLNRGATAELTYRSEDSLNNIGQDIAFDILNTNPLQQDNEAKAITNYPALVRQFAQSGVFEQILRLKVPPQIQETMLPIVLQLRLTMNDHSGEWSTIVNLHPQAR